MKRFSGFAAAAGVLGAAAFAFALHRTGVIGEPGRDEWALLETYCTDCHNDVDRTGDISFVGMTRDSIPDHAEMFEAAIRKLRGRLMPPPGSPHPGNARVDDLVAFLERSIDEAPTVHRAGHVPVQRLNRTEYAAAVEDLLGVEIDPTEILPEEIEVDGFINIAAALGVSPTFLEQYVAAARNVAALAVGTANPKPTSASYSPPPLTTTDDQDDYIDGLPPGTRGGMRFTHYFPADGEYRFTLTDLDVDLYPRAIETEHTVVILIDRNEVFREKLGGPEDLKLVDRGGAPARAAIMARFTDIPIAVEAGVHEVVVTFIERGRVATDELIFGFTPYGGFGYVGEQRVPRLVGSVEVVGPFAPTGLSTTKSREKIFVCRPESADAERACAERIAARLARRAFRRPVTDDDIAALMSFYDAGREGPGGFDEGIEHLVSAVLVSPDFLYRAISPTSSAAADGETFALNDFELASRLSFFLWSRGPDDRLLELAEAGRLTEPDVLQAEVERMLADPRAEKLVTEFALRWLDLDDLDEVVPDEALFPGFDDGLRAAFETEIELFLKSVLLEDRSVHELLTARHTFLNERLARHYGIDSVLGPQFRRVELDDPRRFGLLGKGAVLLKTSYGDRTSPVLRGAWVLEKLMGTPPAPPPPNVETDLSTPAGEKPKTIRARLEQHRESPSCNGCHGVIDPYGLALENFTVIGEWRDYDGEADAPIDASTMLPGDTVVEGPVELREALLARPDQFVQALTEKLLMYALNRELEYFDMPQVRAIVREAERDGYRFSAIVAGVVKSDAFRMQAPRRSGPGESTIAARSSAAVND